MQLSRFVPLLLLPACIATEPLQDDVDLGETEAQVTGSTATTSPRFTVRIGDKCSGVVLNERWVLTTAYCASVATTRKIDIIDSAGSMKEHYFGPVNVYSHPEWAGTNGPLFDFALIYLVDRGANAGYTAATLFADDRFPSDEDEVAAGRNAMKMYGYGKTGAGCDIDSVGLRVGSSLAQYQFDDEFGGEHWFVPWYAVKPGHAVHPCGTRDHGGPWTTVRGGKELVFAMSTDYGPAVASPSDLHWSDSYRGTKLYDGTGWNWIRSTIENRTASVFDATEVSSTSGGYATRRYEVSAKGPQRIASGFGYCLERLADTSVVSKPCRAIDAQRWSWLTSGEVRAYEVLPSRDGVCLTMGTAQRVFAKPCEGVPSTQRFYVVDDGLKIRNSQGGLCLRHNGAAAQATFDGCALVNEQIWVVSP